MTFGRDFDPAPSGDRAFSIDGTSVTFGAGCLSEAGDHARALGIRRIALMTDKRLAGLEQVDRVKRSLSGVGIDVALYQEVAIEPTDKSFGDAARCSRERRRRVHLGRRGFGHGHL